MAIFVVGALGALAIATLPIVPAAAASTVLSIFSGPAFVTPSGASTRPAVDGDLLAGGDQVRTGADGYALLTYFDGSTMSLEPETSVTVEEASLREGATVIRLYQAVGRTWYSVSSLAGPGSRYEVRTPTATASVRGTAFEVSVERDGTTRVRTAEGAVEVSNARGAVNVTAGTRTTASPDAAPTTPVAEPLERRTLDTGDAPTVIVDAAGRACGQHPRLGLLRQIPGCLVARGAIELRGPEAVGQYSVAVLGGAPARALTERTVGADGRVIERVVEVSATEPKIVAPAGARAVPLPIIGALPLPTPVATQAQAAFPGLTFTPPATISISTASPTTAAATLPASLPTLVPTSVPTATEPAAVVVPVPSVALPTLTPTLTPPSPTTFLTPTPVPALPPVPTATATLVAIPTTAPTATPLPTIVPTATPLATIVPTLTPLPTIGLAPTPTPTPTPTTAPAATPTPAATATATPAPTSAPTPAPTPPAAPASLSSSKRLVVLATVIDLSWATSSGATSYDIRRGATSGGPYISVGSASGTTFTDSLPLVSSNCYVVYAIGPGGTSSASPERCETVP